MNQISDPPNDYDFGLDFNYAVWTAATSLDFCNVPWNNDYRDIVKFADQYALDAYITNAALRGIHISNSRYAPATAPIRIDVPFNKAVKYNYVRATNPAQPLTISGPDEAKSFYYFISDVRYIAPNTTEIVVQLDVWQTYGYGIKFGNCYLHRGHIGIANENRMKNYGRDFLTVPEGLDLGSDYIIRRTYEEDVMIPFGVDEFSILVASSIDLLADPGTVEAPKVNAAKGGTFSMLPSGATYYVFKNSTSFQIYLSGISATAWVGNGITSITVIPNIKRYWPTFVFNADGTPTKAPSSAPLQVTHNMRNNFRTDIMDVEPKYKKLDKLKVSPYAMCELTTWSGTPIAIKPELWNSADALIREYAQMIPPTQRIVFTPYGYNASLESLPNGQDNGEGLDFATLIQQLPTLAIVNNMSSMYLAANAANLAYQQNSADWSQQKALAAASAGYDNATSGMDMNNSLAQNARTLDSSQTYLGNRTSAMQSIVSSVGSAVGGASSGMVGGKGGAAIGAISGMAEGIAGNINTLIQLGANTEGLTMRNAANLANVNDQLRNSGFVRDTNRNLAEYAARGDYENTIAGINAKVQDSKFIQPTTVGQVGGDMLNLVHLKCEVAFRVKTIDAAHVRTIGDYWLRYGYAVNQFATPPESLMCMTKFTYWKMSETYITGGDMPEGFRQAIRGMFEKGVTVWTNPDDIGNIDLGDNEILEGITL